MTCNACYWYHDLPRSVFNPCKCPCHSLESAGETDRSMRRKEAVMMHAGD